MYSIVLSFLILSFPQNVMNDSQVTNKFDLLNDILLLYSNDDGGIDYTSIQKNPFGLNQFLEFIEQISPESNPELFNDSDTKAYWINVYNALAIKTIIDNPGIESIREVSWGMGAFWRNKFIVGGEKMTLNHIEHKILRKRYSDPRIHFAINCASNSCPPIGNRIVTGTNLDLQLDKKTIDFINDDSNIFIDIDAKTIHLSRIFKWFRKDFLKDQNTLIKYVLKYRSDVSKELRNDLLTNYKIKFLKYDWSLND